MPDIGCGSNVLTVSRDMEGNASDVKFKVPEMPVVGILPGVPRQCPQSRTAEWLQKEVDPEVLNGSSSHIDHLTDHLEVDFKALHHRKQSTSTPFLARTLSLTMDTSSVENDSGIDSSFCASTLTRVTNTVTTSCYGSINESTSHLSNSDVQELLPPMTLSKLPHTGPLFADTLLSSKCSDTDSAFEDVSISSHNLTQDSQTSICSTLELNSDTQSIITDVQTSDNQIPVVCTKQSSKSLESLPSMLSTVSCTNTPYSCQALNHSESNLSLPPPSWCTPQPFSKLALSSTPKEAVLVPANIQELLKNFSPKEPDRLIGRKMGLENVDIIQELSQRGVSSLKTIFSLLQPEDLCRACLVSSQWRSAIHADSNAVKRKQVLLKPIDVSLKENMRRKSFEKQCQQSMTRSINRKSKPMGSIQSVATKITVPTEHTLLPSTPRHQLFWEEASKCRVGESIRKCPRCTGPAKVHNLQERGKCTSEKCSFDFCIRCNTPFHGARDCSLSLTKKAKSDIPTVGGKKSKRNLRRL